ncbi:SAM-dependent methyltransferase [Solimonas variicoloris]|uniref:SAM-dependent methyltransferase n=1 Tax=Solimonas variicoloris TaxID=254408 RepID=UPI00036B17C5|nr:class I SAM-dependent methyltransferase [Solimonas variicoloris]
MREFWDQRYAAPEYAYGTTPNRFLTTAAAALPAHADVLLPGDGEGRNGVWLAQQGHRVLSVDQSQTGLDKARRLAEQQGVTIDTLCADLASWQPPPAAFDALVLIFLHLPPAQRHDIHRRLLGALRPGGRLILEGFERGHFGLPGGGPRDIDWLFTTEDLRRDFGGLEDLRIEPVETVLDEGPFHHGAARVIRCTGRVPAAR